MCRPVMSVNEFMGGRYTSETDHHHSQCGRSLQLQHDPWSLNVQKLSVPCLKYSVLYTHRQTGNKIPTVPGTCSRQCNLYFKSFSVLLGTNDF